MHKILECEPLEPDNRSKKCCNSRYFSPWNSHVEASPSFPLSNWHSFDFRIELLKDIWCKKRRDITAQERKYWLCYSPTLPSSGADMHYISREERQHIETEEAWDLLGNVVTVSRFLSPPMLVNEKQTMNWYVHNAVYMDFCVYALCAVSHLHDTPLYSVLSCSRFFALAPNPVYRQKKIIQ